MPEVRDQIKTQSAAGNTNKKKAPGLTFRRFFTKPGVSPYSEVEWELRNAQITDSQGGMIFEQKNVEVPKDWSITATNVVASKYLHGQIGTDERETGVRQLVTRVAAVSYTHLRAHETRHDLVCRLLLEKKKKK